MLITGNQTFYENCLLGSSHSWNRFEIIKKSDNINGDIHFVSS